MSDVVFEVEDTCDVLSLVHVDFKLGHAIIYRGVSRIDWTDIGSYWGNEVVR